MRRGLVRLTVMASSAIALLQACSMDDARPGVSDNLTALRAIVDLDIPATSGRWEIFGTPEYTGGVPGPTDFTTLVAELNVPGAGWFDTRKEAAGPVWIAPEAARAWLHAPFRQLLANNKNSTASLSGPTPCRHYGATMTKSGRQVDGFVCADAARLLVYLILTSRQ